MMQLLPIVLEKWPPFNMLQNCVKIDCNSQEQDGKAVKRKE